MMPPQPSQGNPPNMAGGFYVDPNAVYYNGFPPPYYTVPPLGYYPQLGPVKSPVSPLPVQQAVSEPQPANSPIIVAERSVKRAPMIRLKNRSIPDDATTESTTSNPLKDELTRALNEASKEMDKVKHNAALSLSSFDDLDWKPESKKTIPRMSLSDETVPVDNHILNWRDLVGLPQSRSSLSDGANPIAMGTL
jgi:hypothetical protein